MRKLRPGKLYRAVKQAQFFIGHPRDARRGKIKYYKKGSIFMFLEAQKDHTDNTIDYVFLAPDSKTVWDGFNCIESLSVEYKFRDRLKKI